jgi:GAF domain-containing protein
VARLREDGEEAVTAFLRLAADRIVTATADSVTIRVLSSDGQRLEPIAAVHPDPAMSQTMSLTMETDIQLAGSIWSSVLSSYGPTTWQFFDSSKPNLLDTSDEQKTFIEKYRLRAVLAVPLRLGIEPVGTVALARFGVDRNFSSEDISVAVACGRWISPALGLVRAFSALAGEA